VKESGFVFGGLDVVETTLHSSLKDLNERLEVAEEQVTLEVLNFSVLNWSSSEGGIQLHGLVGSSTSLILTGLFSEPEVNIPLEGVALLEGVQDDITVAIVELAIFL
jgi:hypothetical protein